MTALRLAWMGVTALVAGCGVLGPPARPAAGAPEGRSGPVEPDAVPADVAADARPFEGRCAKVCALVAGVTGAGESPGALEGWRKACEAACGVHASSGQLECFERVRRVEDVDACGVR